MKKNINYLLLFAALTLGLSAPTFADTLLMIPSQKGGVKVGLDPLYLRATNSDSDYATSFSFPPDTTDTVTTNAIVDPSYTWGVYAQLGYLFPCTGNDITLGYTYLHTSDTASLIPSSTSDISFVSVLPAGSLGLAGLQPAVFDSATSKSEFTLNAADLEFGQRFMVDSCDIRLFTGLRYANINSDFFANAFIVNGNVPPNTVYIPQEFTSQYRGIGPRLGVEGRYSVQGGFGFDANVSSALLVGNIDAKYNASLALSPTSPSIASFEETNGSSPRIVPVVEAKLGVDYAYIMDSDSKSSLVFEIGYQTTTYFNAVDRGRIVEDTILSDSRTIDATFDGMYLGVKYYG